jgi:8-oxo-dGTP pyrophosphatase MutT (NUDIX family)
VSPARGGPQKIPRPPGVRIGGPAPWADTPAAHRSGITLERVRGALSTLGPPRRPELVLPGARSAAVLAPLFEEQGETRVVLTRRTTTLPSHRGEVSFPGGKVIEGEDLWVAALREANEEIGLVPAAVEVIGELDHLATVASRFVLAPYVGALAARPALTPNPHEVDRVFDVSIAELLDDDAFREERWEVFGEERSVFFFELVGDTVWGATARILHQLLALLTVGDVTNDAL